MKPFSELTDRERNTELLRWLLVPVAAVLLGFVLPRIIGAAVFPPMFVQPPGSPPIPPPSFQRVLFFRALMFASAAVFVVVGAKTAPRFNRTTAIVLAAFWIFRSLMWHVVVHLGQGTPHYFDFSMSVVAAVCGMAFIFYSKQPCCRAAETPPA